MSSNTDVLTGASPLTRGRMVALVAVLILGVLSYQLNSSMLNPALPDMAERLGVSVDAVSQVISLFFLAGAVGGVVLARWSDFIGRRRMFIMVLSVLAVGTLVCIFATSLPMLLVGRVLQGATAAAFPLAYIILNENLSRQAFGTAMGVVTAVNGGVGGVDAYVGGLLSDTWGYRSIFVAILAFGVIGMVAIATVVPRDGAPKSAGTMDWWGAAAFSAGLIGLTYYVSEGGAQGWLAPSSLVYLALTVAAFLVFWVIEKRVSSPLVAVEHLKSRRVWPVMATTVLVLSGVFAVINFTLVILTQNSEVGLGMSASRSALLVLLPPALIGVAAAPVAGWLAGRYGWLRILRIGLVICIVGIAAVTILPPSMPVVLFAVVLFGVAYYGMALTTVNGLGVLQSPKDEPGILPGLNGAMFGIGASLGISFVAPYVGRETSEGFVTALAISLGITILALVASLLVKPAEGSVGTRRTQEAPPVHPVP
ncbi:MFS transporter [Georgenia sp. H159]|uniref:MFS transporter n=1 Tax=Georgenia sp. H159 TaxID=3076115 RepID=UPI002D78D245|nr:MFS transporter [Georgenia sp. H159]